MPFDFRAFMQRFKMKCGLKSKPRTILFSPLDSIGHLNSLISIANHLKSQGHRTVFLFMEPLMNNLKQMGHEVYDSTTPDLSESVASDEAQNKWNEVIKMCQQSWQEGDIIKNFEQEMRDGFGQMISDIQKYNDNVAKKLELIRPDILVIDHYFGIPALFKYGKPWIRIFSASPLALHNEPKLPRAFLGLPTNWNKDDPQQKDWTERANKVHNDLYDRYNEYWRSFGLPDLPKDPVGFIPLSPHFNLYMYPEEIDYEYPLNNWNRCDCMVRDQKAAKFEVPEKLRDKPGKLIFLSLGSLASADVILMKRLVSMLADCPHRFIVAKGPCGHEYELAENMWGDAIVPQLEILRAVDLVITHGGNNTLTESFYYGVPAFIVCPLFGDQFDNAQRLEEKGLGIRIDPYNCTKEQLFEAIEKMLANEEAKKKIRAISERMQKPEYRNKAINIVSEFVNQV